MLKYLDFKDARCKDCYKCLRECPVKAIKIVNHQARIIEDRCILCGKCTKICPQNAKAVHSEKQTVYGFLSKGLPVIASVAPSFAAAFKVESFAVMAEALRMLGFTFAEETAVGAKIVSEEYIALLKKGTFKNFITSACPGINAMIQRYHPEALDYLAPVDTPMLAHAKVLKKRFPGCAVVFLGPCIAKKREAFEGNVVDAVLTFEELSEMFDERLIRPEDISVKAVDKAVDDKKNRARYYPISRGIIKSFGEYPEPYEYVAVDGVARCNEVLENIESFSGLFLELNCCEYACIGGPCNIQNKGGSVKANEDTRHYALSSGEGSSELIPDRVGASFTCMRGKIMPAAYTPSEREISEILAQTGKTSKEDELNCGACGYQTCREKAWAVANGYADNEMCIPYMRSRAETMSYEIIQNTPNGIILLDSYFKIYEINKKAKDLFGIKGEAKGCDAVTYFNPTEFIVAAGTGQNLYGKKLFLQKTDRYVELNVILLKSHNVILGVIKDITEATKSQQELDALKMQTLETTDAVVKKQMRVAQEIASLLGETTAETKVAILKLKKTLQSSDGQGEL